VKTLRALNPAIDVRGNSIGLTPKTAIALVSDFDLVLDCTDNPMSRYLLNDACVVTGRTLVSGAAIGCEGQVTVYSRDEESPCYRCLFPEAPPPSCVGTCDAAGVFGPVPGVIGTLQAMETIKLLSRPEGSRALIRRMVLYDGADCSFRTVKLRSRSPSCIACGDGARIDVATFDYLAFLGCSISGSEKMSDRARLPVDPCHRLSPVDFRATLRSSTCPLLIDVRPRSQFLMCRLPDSRNVPLSELPGQLDDLRRSLVHPETPLMVVCRRGNDSQRALTLLLDAGFTNAWDLIGGLDGWRSECDPSFPLY